MRCEKKSTTGTLGLIIEKDGKRFFTSTHQTITSDDKESRKE